MATLLTIIQRLLDPRPDFSGLSRRPPHNAESGSSRRLQWRHFVLNVPLLLGAAIVGVLFLMVLFGPVLAQENPYLAGRRTISYEDGNIIAPPFPPSAEYLLGTDANGKDILSLILYGARNTLVACTFIAMSRVLIGVVLGAIAGWNEGKTIDRLVTGAIALTTALPILLSSMILIYALDIRRGLTVFIIALSVVGWGEVAQFIRSEFIVLRQRPFIEGAQATGLPGPQIAVRHIVPNILPQLIVITLLEMSAVLMLLGELGFIGVYIGGGTASTNFNDERVTLIDVPEWGVMMADARRWVQSKPWMVFYPALAFFVAVFGFNALAEGIRRLVEQAAINTAFLLRKRMLVIIATITLMTIYTVNNVGPAPTYARLADNFNGEAALAHAQTLVGLTGRQYETGGNRPAANYIAEQFAAFGLQPGGRDRTYFHRIDSFLVRPETPPGLMLVNQSGQKQKAFVHGQGFGYVTRGHGGSGQAEAPLTFIGFRSKRVEWEDFRGLNLSGRIVLLLADNAPPDFATEAQLRGAVGVLWVSNDIRSQRQLAGSPADYLRRPTLPIFRITPAVAEILLAEDDTGLADLRRLLTDWPADSALPWFTHPLTARLSMSLALAEPEPVQLVNVLGYLPGGDVALDDRLVILSAHYDSPGFNPDNRLYEGANDNIAGVAMMLETARLWQTRGLTPRRSVLFAAWDGGNLDYSGADAYFDGYLGPISLLEPELVFQLDNVGAGGRKLRVNANSDRLTALMQASATQAGVPLQWTADSYHPYNLSLHNRTGSVLLSWLAEPLPPAADIAGRLEPQKFNDAGRVLLLALTTAAREPEY